MPIVDAHPHIYSPDREAYPTIADPWEPGEPASADDLKMKMDAVGVDRAVFIQTSTFYGHDNHYVMDMAKEHSDWACGVVTLDPDDASHLDLLEDAVANSNIRGMRGTSDSINRISSPNVYRLWAKAMELGIPVNCMVMDDLDRVPEIERIAQDLGDLKIVIDHCFMLNTRHKTEETLVALERLSKLPNVYAKLTSGTHGSYRVYPYPDMHGPLRRVIEAFGSGRCVWGSNFPNELWSKGATYAQNLHLFVKQLDLSLPEKADILGLTALSLWFPEESEQTQAAAKEQQERSKRESIRAQQEAEPPEQEEIPEETGHVAEITRMADLIAREGIIEGPIVDEVDGVELSAILDAANELNKVLDIIEFPEKSAMMEPETAETPEDAVSGEFDEAEEADEEPDEELETEQSVNVDELLAAQNYKPRDTSEPDKSDETDTDVAADVQAQLDAALGNLVQDPDFEIPGMAEAEQATQDSADAEVNIDELFAVQNYKPIDTASIGQVDAPDMDIAADVQAQLDAALGGFTDIPNLEIADDEPVDDDEPVIDVASLLAEQAEGETAVAGDVQAQIDAAFADLAAYEPAEEQVPEAEPEPTINVDELLAAQASAGIEPGNDAEAASTDDDAADGPVTVDVTALLAAQNYTPLDTASYGVQDSTSNEDSDDDGELDLSALMDVADQLNSALESVDDIAASMNDLAEDVDDQSQRPSA